MTEIAKNSMNFGGRLSREFAIFGKFFLHKFTKCITLRSILVNDLSLASVRIPLINICLIFKVIDYFKETDLCKNMFLLFSKQNYICEPYLDKEEQAIFLMT